MSSKVYGKQYFFKGGNYSTGSMICAACRKPILPEVHDWRSGQRNIKEGVFAWEYITHHRECLADQSGWEDMLAAKEASKLSIDNAVKELSIIKTKYPSEVFEIAIDKVIADMDLITTWK